MLIVISKYRSSGEFCSVDCDYKTDCNGHGICDEYD